MVSHTAALMALIGLELPVDTALAAISAMLEATRLRPPLVGRSVLRVTPECAQLLRRAALSEEFNSIGLFSLGRALMRREANDAELLVVSCGEDAPRITAVPMRLLRAIFASRK